VRQEDLSKSCMADRRIVQICGQRKWINERYGYIYSNEISKLCDKDTEYWD
jgi:hypothetical protein